MKVIPYINFKGNAEEALRFYADALKGEFGEIMRFNEDMYPNLPDHMKDWVMHAELRFGDNAIYISDTPETEKYQMGNALTIHLDCYSNEEIHNLFDSLSNGGTILDPLSDTFWGAVYGALIDRYGVQWSFNYQKD